MCSVPSAKADAITSIGHLLQPRKQQPEIRAEETWRLTQGLPPPAPLQPPWHTTWPSVTPKNKQDTKSGGEKKKQFVFRSGERLTYLLFTSVGSQCQAKLGIFNNTLPQMSRHSDLTLKVCNLVFSLSVSQIRLHTVLWHWTTCRNIKHIVEGMDLE